MFSYVYIICISVAAGIGIVNVINVAIDRYYRSSISADEYDQVRYLYVNIPKTQSIIQEAMRDEYITHNELNEIKVKAKTYNLNSRMQLRNEIFGEMK